MPARPFKPYRRQSFQSLIERIHFNTDRFEGRYPQQRLGARVAEDNRAADDFAHEFNIRGRDVELEFGAIGQLIRPLTFRLKADGFKVRPWGRGNPSPQYRPETALPKCGVAQPDCEWLR